VVKWHVNGLFSMACVDILRDLAGKVKELTWIEKYINLILTNRIVG